MKTASYYQKTDDGRVQCLLCPHQCQIAEGKSGICSARVNRDNELISENYGKISSLGVDPIEKKPLYHFYPASRILSLGTFGCNLSCPFCQNWRISQNKPDLQEFTPEEIINVAQRRNSRGLAYTYSEPLIWYEFVYDTGKLAHENDMYNVLVTNGYINKEPLKALLPYIDAANIDLKSFNNEFYRNLCGGTLQPVLDNIEIMNEKIHVELTTLIIPGENDSLEELKKLFSWVAELNHEIPLHISRYFPNYKFDRPAASGQKMEEIYQLAAGYLDYVYLGNMRTDEGATTFCPECGENLIVRSGYHTDRHMDGDKCPVCGYQVAGVFPEN